MTIVGVYSFDRNLCNRLDRYPQPVTVRPKVIHIPYLSVSAYFSPSQQFPTRRLRLVFLLYLITI